MTSRLTKMLWLTLFALTILLSSLDAYADPNPALCPAALGACLNVRRDYSERLATCEKDAADSKAERDEAAREWTRALNEQGTLSLGTIKGFAVGVGVGAAAVAVYGLLHR